MKNKTKKKARVVIDIKEKEITWFHSSVRGRTERIDM
jgi:hypothetical protein